MNRSELALPGFAGVIAIAVMFAALARGAHDLWAATLVHALLLGWVAAFLVNAYLRRSEISVRLPLLMPAALLLCVAIVAAVFAANRFDAVFAVKDLAAAIVAFYAGANVFQDDESIDLLLMLIVPVLWVQAATMTIQMVTTGAVAPVESPGTLVNANIQAAFAVFWVPPLAARTTGRRFSYFASGAVAALTAIILSGSTWALLCVLVVAVAAKANRVNKPGLVKAVLTAGALVVVGVLWYKLTKTSVGEDRLRWWTAAFHMFKDHPWLGVGPGGFPSAYPSYKYGSGQSTLFAHSLPVTVIAEMGVAGAAASLAFLLIWKRKASVGFDHRGTFAVGALLFIASSLVNVGGEYFVNQLTLALFLGISVAGAPASLWRPRLAAAVLISGVAVLLMPLLLAPFLASRFIVDGTSLLAAKDYVGAGKRFRLAVELDSSNWEGHYGLALAEWFAAPPSTPERREAIEEIRRAIARNRLNPGLRAEESRMLQELGG